MREWLSESVKQERVVALWNGDVATSLSMCVCVRVVGQWAGGSGGVFVGGVWQCVNV